VLKTVDVDKEAVAALVGRDEAEPAIGVPVHEIAALAGVVGHVSAPTPKDCRTT
jgi:hypothetical protein